MSNLQTDMIIERLKQVPNALGNFLIRPPKFQKKILHELDPTKTTVAVYSDNLIDDPEKWFDRKGGIDASVAGSGAGETVGIEALAWYASYHHNQKDWGIYIPVSSIHYLNEVLEIKIHSETNLDQISKQILEHHERYHFLTDLAVSQLELFIKTAIYRPHKDLYKIQTPFLKSNEDYNELEENLANSFMLKEMKTLVSKSQLKKILSWVKTLPAGYRDGAETFLDLKRGILEKDNLNRFLALVAADAKLNIVDPALDLSVFLPEPEEKIVSQCPIYILDDAGEHGLDRDIVRFFQKMEKIEETKKFRKMLSKIPQKIQNAWKKKRNELEEFLPKPPKFEKFKQYYSLRLPDGFRAHFLKPEKNETTWLAVEIGDHLSMGHGK